MSEIVSKKEELAKPIEREISDMESRLNATKAALQRGRGPVEEAVIMIVPMMQDQLKIMREMLALIKE